MIRRLRPGNRFLELTGIGKDFGAIRALHGIDMRVSPRGGRPHGRQRRPEIDAREVIAGNFRRTTARSASRATRFISIVRSMPRAVGIGSSTRISPRRTNLTAAANVFLDAERKEKNSVGCLP